MEFNKEQQEILNDNKSREILISASAGTGKTTIMLAKVVNLISDLESNITLDQIVFLAFNNSVAQEIRAKLAEQLTKKIEENREDKDLVHKLREELDRVNNGNIATLDAYEQKILKEYSYAIDEISADFNIIDDDQDIILEEASKQVIKFRKDKKTEALFSEGLRVGRYNGEVKGSEDFSDIILKCIKFASKQYDPDLWINNIGIYVEDDIKKDYLISLIKHYCGTLMMFQDPGSEECQETIDFFNKVSNLNLVEIEKSIEVLEEKIKDEVPKSICKKVIENLEKDIQLYKSCTIGYKESTEQYMTLFKKLAFNVLNSVRERKISRQEFSYSDITYYVIKLLSERTEIRVELQNKIKYVFVDEFQDLSPIQHRFIELINGGVNTKSIYVGDIKQSIYKFRDAAPKEFLKIEKLIREGKRSGAIYYLNKNYRSSSNILDSVNKIMSSVMNFGTSSIDYNKDGKFSLDKVDEENNYIFKNWSLQTTGNKNEILAQCAVPFISETIDKESVFSVQNKTVGILVEENAGITEISKQLNLLGKNAVGLKVDNETQADKNYSSYMFIKLIYNPYDNKTINYFILNEYFDINIHDLSVILKEIIGEDFIIEAMRKYLKNNNNEISKKLNKFFIFYDELHNNRFELNWFDIYEKLIKNRDDDSCSIWSNSVMVDLCFTNFYIFTKRMEYNSEKLLIDVYQDLNNNKFSYPEEDNNDIKDKCEILTVHRAKGLEWNYVFYVVIKTRNNSGYISNIFSNKYGYFHKINNEKTLCDLVLKIEELELVEEQFRKLYVALTRAKDKLYILCLNKDKSYTAFPVMSQYGILYAYYCCKLGYNMDSYEDQDLVENKNIFRTFIENPIAGFENEINDYKNKVINNNLLTYYSTTKINEIHKDIKKASLTYINQSNNQDLSSFGTLYHDIFENIDYNKTSRNEIKEEVNKILLKNDEYSVYLDDIVEDFYQILNGELGYMMRMANNVHREFSFSLYDAANQILDNEESSDKIIVIGRIDLLLEGLEGKNYLIDYKLSTLDEESLKISYEKQLEVYKQAIELGRNIKIDKKFLYSIKMKKLIEV